jgi:protein TonB
MLYPPASGVKSARVAWTEPDYPWDAKISHAQGSVSLWATIGKDGKIDHLEVIGGLPVFQKSAVDAVKTWRYKPFLVDGVPSEVGAMITINYRVSP